MAQEQAKLLLQQGITAAKAGQADQARELLRQAARLDPQNETTWMWLTSVAESTDERIFCLRQILQINPQNERALQGLQQLGAATGPAAPVPGSGSVTPPPQGIGVPVVDDQKFARIQQAADEFLRRYNPEPLDRLQIDWTHKTRQRYAEMGEQRIRRVVMAVAAVVAVGVLAGVLVLVSQLDISLGLGGKDNRIEYAVVLSATPTAEWTPTLGGSTPTPFPENMAVPPTGTIPPNLKQQSNPYVVMNPTEIYPPPNSFAKVGVGEAVKYYSIGDYDTAIEKLEQERKGAGQNCYESVIYYLALSLAHQGDYDEANRIIRDALNTPTGGFESCQGSTLLVAGQGEVAFLSGNLNAAASYSAQALAEDPLLVQASLTAAQVELARGQTQNAWRILNVALDENPDDVNLLLLLAEVEMAGGQADQLRNALDYVGQVLFIEPVLLPALQLHTQLYLKLAEETVRGNAAEQYYSLAVVSAQTLLLYYPGDPLGYLYLAQARFGEGNDELAETALARILAADGDLPSSAAPVIREARRLRGNLEYEQGRLQAAWDDLEPIALTRSSDLDLTVAERLADIALRLGRYSDAADWIDQLWFAEPDDAEYILLRAKILVELCTFYSNELSCEYDEMLETLDDTQFLAQLTTDEQRAQAYSYRGQARYGDTKASALSADEQVTQFRLALNDIEQALMIRDSAIDHYYRGVIYEILDEPARAFEEYQWLEFWKEQQYGYPFVNQDFEDLATEVGDLMQATLEAEASAEPPIVLPTRVPPTNTPTPTRTPTRTPTPSPTPEPTALPSTAIP